MIIETTLNINIEKMKMLKKASCFTGESMSKIIIILLKKIMTDNRIKANINRSIKYQKKDNINNWHRFHIYLRENDYEYFLDLRKIYKMSVSHLLSYAIKRFLNEILKGGNTDNYRFTNYILAKQDISGVIIWQLFWGIPENLEKILFH
ncbi:hypothetical protein ACFL20_10965 [Spirochaetota bacterium]